jgi:phosphatidylserine/phosphatidylglycerophosphate/cardiolipin synthase-like enzyme
MNRYSASLAALLAATNAQTQALASSIDVETHYSPAENLERIDVAQIGGATKSLDMAAFVLSDVAVINALSEAAGRGVKIRVYRDANPRNPRGAVAEALAALAASPNVAIKAKGSRTYMHLKSYCIDGKVFRSGAANFSASGLKHQDNDLTLARGENACAAFDANFKILWGE